VSHHIVEVAGLRYAYPDGTKALDGVSFRITHGESVALVGANGAGKSTLLLHLNGCLLPAAGTVRIGDFPVTKATLAAVRRSVGMVFQDPDDQLFMPTVFDDVAFGPLNLGLPPEEAEARVTRALETVDAVHLRDRPPYRLSAGEKRAAAIATVLAMSPDILVLDEPTAGLDPRSRRSLIRLLASFQHTKILATHDLDLALDLCARTIVMQRGRVAADGPTAQLLRNRALLEESHLELPHRLQACPVCGRAAEADEVARGRVRGGRGGGRRARLQRRARGRRRADHAGRRGPPEPERRRGRRRRLRRLHRHAAFRRRVKTVPASALRRGILSAGVRRPGGKHAEVHRRRRSGAG
jgi:cobalt/nickel transport system ATP-binding protein